MDKPEYKTKIKIEGDTKGAEAGIRRVSTRMQNLTKVAEEVNRQLRSDRINRVLSGLASRMDRLVRAANNFRKSILDGMRSVAIFGLAVEGIKRLVEIWQTANRLIEQFRTRLERADFASHVARAASETRSLVSAQGELNQKLNEQLDILQRTFSLRSMATSGQQTFADEQRTVARAVELAGVTDPRERQAIEDRYAQEDEARGRAQSISGIAEKIRQLEAEAKAYEASARQSGELATRLVAQNVSESAILAKQTEQQNGGLLKEMFGGNEAGDEQIAATKKRIEALGQSLKAANEEKRTFEIEAAYRRQQIAILQEQQKSFQNLGTSAQTVADATWKKMDEADAEANRRLAEKLSANEAADKWARDFGQANTSEKIAMLSTRENDARGRMTSLQDELDREMAKAVSERSSARLDELRGGIESAQGEMFSARRQREALEEANAAGVSGLTRENVTLSAASRLNAMGLGSGSGVQRIQEQMATSLKDMVRFAREQLNTLKDIRNNETGAVFQ